VRRGREKEREERRKRDIEERGEERRERGENLKWVGGKRVRVFLHAALLIGSHAKISLFSHIRPVMVRLQYKWVHV
jgi:hypothetical protein